MGSILIAMPTTKDANHLSELINRQGIGFEIEVCQTAGEILRLSHDRDSGIVIVPTRLRDMGYMELAEYLPDNFGMIVLTKDVSLETFSDKTVKLIMPFKAQELVSTIEMMTSNFGWTRSGRRMRPTGRSVTDQRVIDEAKSLLMERNGMTEPEAFRYIQKNSMDTGRKMVESAQVILLLNR